MNGRQEWSSIPCVVTGWGYKDHGLFSEFLRGVYTAQVYTYNDGAELELQYGQSKLGLKLPHVFVTPRHSVGVLRTLSVPQLCG